MLAVGNPFGLGGTVTAGIVSARGRDIGAGPYDDFIQIDAPVNKGNSGGPTFDVDGNVIGVNTAIFSPSGGSVGIAFDIPAETVKSVVAQLRDKGSVTRGWIGVQIQTVTPDIADSMGLKQATGALVSEPQKNSPAATAGIQSGDVITSVDGTPIHDARELARKIGTMAPGASVKLGTIHGGQDKTVTLTLGTLPTEKVASNDQDNQRDTADAEVPKLGLTLAPADKNSGGCRRCRHRRGRRRRCRRARLPGRRRHSRHRRQDGVDAGRYPQESRRRQDRRQAYDFISREVARRHAVCGASARQCLSGVRANEINGAGARFGAALRERGIRWHPSPPLAGVPGGGPQGPSPLNTNSASGIRRPRWRWSGRGGWRATATPSLFCKRGSVYHS